jgi:hypothetical protein
MQNRLPPFGRVLLAYQHESIRLDFPLYIFVGKNAKEEAYSHKKAGSFCSYLPYGDSFEKYNWPIKDQKIVILDTGFTVKLALHKMCHYLLETYSPRVIFLHSDTHTNEIFLPKGVIYDGR